MLVYVKLWFIRNPTKENILRDWGQIDQCSYFIVDVSLSILVTLM